MGSNDTDAGRSTKKKKKFGFPFEPPMFAVRDHGAGEDSKEHKDEEKEKYFVLFGAFVANREERQNLLYLIIIIKSKHESYAR